MKVVVAEDHEFFLYFYQMLSLPLGYEIIGTASKPKQAAGLCQRLEPDLLILDLELTDGHGFEVLELLGEKRPKTLLHTSYATEYVLYECRRRELEGFLSRGKSVEDFSRAIEALFKGERYYSGGIEPGGALLKLSEEEMDVAAALACVRDWRRAPDSIGISLEEMDRHVASINSKLGTEDYRDVARWGVSKGLQFRMTDCEWACMLGKGK